MIIIDINDKSRNVESIKIIEHTRINNCSHFTNENVDGKLETTEVVEEVEVIEKYVETEIIGKSGRKWTEWYPLEEFEKKNPDIKLEE
jgi:hypothetical protein